jgi:hypothetical protein
MLKRAEDQSGGAKELEDWRGGELRAIGYQSPTQICGTSRNDVEWSAKGIGRGKRFAEMTFRTDENSEA